MITGICTLILFFEEQFHWLDNLLPGGLDHHLFHSIHMALFISVVSYITLMCVQMVIAMRFASSLKELEEGTLEEARAKHKDLEAKAFKAGALGFLARRKAQQAFIKLEFHSARSHFIEQHNLPRDFAFFVYMRKCARDSIQNIAGIHWSVWIIIFLVALGDTVRATYWGEDSYGGAIEYMAGAYIAFLISLAIFFKMSSIFKAVLLMEFNASQVISHDPDQKGFKPKGAVTAEDDEEHGHGGHKKSKKEKEADSVALNRHKALFWMGKPAFMARCIQFVTLTIAITLPSYLQYFAAKWSQSGAPRYLHVVALFPAFVVVFVFLPSILPNYIFATSIGELSRSGAIGEALAKTPSIMHKVGDGGHGSGGHGDSHGSGKKKRSSSKSRSHSPLLDEENGHGGKH